MEGNTKITLRIPNQDLEDFSLFALDRDSADQWAQALPVTNTDAVVDLIKRALAELNRVSIPPEVRFEILETLVPSLDVAVSNLSKRFLNQPLVMPEGPQKMADVAARLNALASTAYTIVAIEALQQRETIRRINPALLTCQALQRAVVYSGRKVLQTFQLFRPLEIHGWRSLHQLYSLAESQGLESLPLRSTTAGGTTVRSAYLQAVMLGCCKPNHLRQSDLTSLYRCLGHWGEFVEVGAEPNPEALFVADLHSDQPPLYQSLYKEKESANCRTLNTQKLVEHLQTLRTETNKDYVQVAPGLSVPVSLIDHLISSLGNMSLRNFKRSPANEQLQLCIGLRSVHYHVGGEVEFETLLQSMTKTLSLVDGENRFMPPASRGDVWQAANPREYYVDENSMYGDNDEANSLIDMPSASSKESQDLTERYPVYSAAQADASPGGYCLEWNQDMPGDIRSGDIVGLKESGSQEWSIAVIRWFGRFEDERTLVGLELLSPKAMSFGASIHQKDGEQTPPIRVLLLPEIKLVGQPHTLITPRAGFRERQKITLGNQREECSIQLLRQVTATGEFAQFEYKYVQELGDLLAQDEDVKIGADYDSLWSNI